MLLFALSVTELVATGVYHRPETLPSGWRVTFIGIHIVSFYLNLSGFIYTNEANLKEGVRLAWISLAVNMVSFVTRLIYELVFIDFRPTS